MKDNSNNSPVKNFLEGISGQAEQEAKEIVQEADRQALEILDGARKQAQKILQDARETGNVQGNIIKTGKLKSLESEGRRIGLKAQEELFTIAINHLKEKIGSLRKRPDYKNILEGWIVEGAQGLERNIMVNASGYERGLLTEEVLTSAEKEITKLTGKKYIVKLSSDPPVSSPGIFVSAENGRLVFNNLVEARMQRYSKEVRKMIYRYIQAEKSDEVKRA
jgi:vacuolar-type H+-ATPase subunit E/Vma4